jgi:hypothetical protein
MSGDRVKFAEAEVQKLLDARIIREVQYPVWVANVVMVLKNNGNMRMCIDFTEHNKACPKDPYPLPRIDIIIDQVAGCEMLSLLDCFSEYHQVWMRREDEAKTRFTTPFGIFCFVRMPEGLRNAGPTFNRMMKLILGSQLGRNASAYVDDIVIMSEKEKDHIADLTETFDNMRRNGLKLNPEKCIFGVRKGQLLGCMVSKRGILENPQKIEALRRMQPPSNRKEVQRLTGRIALLNRFISKAAERSLPFFKVLCANSVFQWGAEQQQDLRGSQKISRRGSCHDQTVTEGRAVTVHRSNRHNSQCSASRRANGSRRLEAVPHLLRLRSFERLKTFLLRDGEDGICSCDGKEEASALFSEPQYIGPHSFPSSRHV